MTKRLPKKAAVTIEPKIFNVSNCNVNSNNVINIYVNNQTELNNALEKLSTEKLITPEQLERLKPIQQILQDQGYTNMDQLYGLMEDLSKTTEEQLEIFSDLKGLSRMVAKVVREECGLRVAYDEKKQHPYIRMQPTDIITYLAQKLWLFVFLPDLEGSEKNETLPRLIGRSVRKDTITQSHCDVKTISKVTADGKILQKNDQEWKKYYSDYNLDLDDAIDSEDDENDILFRRGQARNKFEAIDLYNYTRWTRAKWDAVITNGLRTISESICRAASRDLLDSLVQDSLGDYVKKQLTEEYPDKMPYLTITEKAKRDLEKKVIADGKESLVAGWRVIADFLEQTSAQHRRIKERNAGDVVPSLKRDRKLSTREKKNQNQIALHRDGPLLPIA